MDGKQEEAHGGRENRENMAEDLRSWFCQLTTQERVQAIAVEDVVWIRLFNILYRKHKSWMRQQGTPPTWDRDQVRKLWEKVQRSERNRPRTSSMPPAGPCPHGASKSRTTAAESRTMVVPTSRTKADSEERNKEALARLPFKNGVGDDEGGALSKGAREEGDSGSVHLRGSSNASKPCGKRSGVCCDRGGGHNLQTALQVGERLQEAVRLCSLGGESRDGVCNAPSALTLSEAELSRPRKLLHELMLYSCRGDGDETLPEKAQSGGDTSGAKLGGFMCLPLAETNAPRVAMSLMEDPLMETEWLSQRFPKAAIGDLLANRLELSLWASYQRIGTPVVATSLLPDVPRVIEELHAYWRNLSQRHKLRLLDGVPEAKALTARSSCEGSEGWGGNIVRELVLAPIAWCFKDNGESVRDVVERLQRACADHAASDRTGQLGRSTAEHNASVGSDDSDPTASAIGDVRSRGGIGEDVITFGSIASEEGSVEQTASEPSPLANFSKNKVNKKAKRKKKKPIDGVSIASGSAEGSEGAPSPGTTTLGPGRAAADSLGDASLSASEDGSAGVEAGQESSQQGGSKTNNPGLGRNTRSRSGGARVAPSVVDAAVESTTHTDHGWVVSTSRRKGKEPREELKEIRRGAAGTKSNKAKDGGSHPKATAGHRESLRDSQREPYRDRGEVSTRGGKSSGKSEGRHSRDEGSSAPWSRSTSRQEGSNKGESKREDGGTWSKTGASRERREDGLRREKRDGADVGASVVSGSRTWPRAGAVGGDREDKDAGGAWAKDKEGDVGPWTKRSGNNSARENGHPPSIRAKDPHLDRARSSSFADMVRGAQGLAGGEEAPAVSPLVKSKSAKTPKTISAELSTPAWGSGKPGGAPSFATVLLGGSSATLSSNKLARPPALKSVDSKAGVSVVSPATTVSASPVTASETSTWGDTASTPSTASAPKPAAPKPVAWTTGNTMGVLLFRSPGEPSNRSTGTIDECEKDQAAAVAACAEHGRKYSTGSTKSSTSGKESEGREIALPNGRRSPTPSFGEGDGEAEGGGEVRDVMVEVLDKVGDVIVKRAHSRASKAKSYARAIAESEGRAHALATAHQRQDGLLPGSWDDEASIKPVVESDAIDTVASSATGAVESPVSGSSHVDVAEAENWQRRIAPTESSEDMALANRPSPGGSTVAREDGEDHTNDTDAPTGAFDHVSAYPLPTFVAATPSTTDASTGAADVDATASTVEQRLSAPSAPNSTGERVSVRQGSAESLVVPRNGSGQDEQRRGGVSQPDNSGGGRRWSGRERGSDRASSTAASWSRGNTTPNASRNSGRRGVAVDAAGGRIWPRSGQAMGGGVIGNIAGVPSNDFRGGRLRGQRMSMTPGQQQQQQGLDIESGRVAIPMPRAPAPLRSSVSMPISKEISIDAGEALARGYTAQQDAVAPSRVARSPTGHRPRSSSTGGGSARRNVINAGEGMPGGHYPHFQQMDSWNGTEWALSGGGVGGGRRGVRSGGGVWQGRDGEVGRRQYPYRDENFYRSPPVEARPHGAGAGGGGGVSSRHSRQDQVPPHRRGQVDAFPRLLAPHEQQQAQQQQQQQQQQTPQMPLQHQQLPPQISQTPLARFRSLSGSASELSIDDRRAERMEYEYNLMVSCLDRNVDGFMQKLRRAMRPRRRAWSQVIARVHELVAGIWKEAKVEMYGSCYTGLELPSSDVDVVVCGINGRSYSFGSSRAGYNSMQTVANLQKLANVLQEQNWVRGMKVIETAAVPVVKILADPVIDGASGQYLFDEEGGRDGWQGSGSGMDYIPLDISFETPQHGGLASSKWVRECIQGGKYGFALPAVMVLKEVLCQRGLNQPWSGGLSSYSLINMMITVLQRAEVERARARRIVARSHAAAQAAAHIVRQGALPPPQAMPSLSPRMSIGPQPQAMPPLSPQMSVGPQPSVFAPHPPQAVAVTATGNFPMASASPSDFENAARDARVGATDRILLQRHSQPAGETACEDGGGGTAAAISNTGTSRLNSQASVAARGESSCLKTEVNIDGRNRTQFLKNVSAEVGQVGRQRASFVPADVAADHPTPAALMKRKTSYWGESDPSRGRGAGSFHASGEPGIQPVAVDGFGGASIIGLRAKTALPNGLSPGKHVGRGGRIGEGMQASAPAVSLAGAALTMYPAQAGQASMQQVPMPPVQGPMPPLTPQSPVAPPATQHSIGINADLFHMKHMEITLSQEEVDRADLSGMTSGEVLVRFLEFFGRQFDSSRLGISVGRGALSNPFPLAPSVDPRTGMAVMDAHVVIEDPLDRDQNVARSCFGFPQVQWLFGQCLSLLQERGAEIAEYDRDADLLKMLVYF